MYCHKNCQSVSTRKSERTEGVKRFTGKGEGRVGGWTRRERAIRLSTVSTKLSIIEKKTFCRKLLFRTMASGLLVGRDGADDETKQETNKEKKKTNHRFKMVEISCTTDKRL